MKIFFILILLSTCQSRSHLDDQQLELSSVKAFDFSALKEDTLECGTTGNLLQRIQDCRTKNPSISSYQSKKRPHTWTQVSHFKTYDFHLWLDQKLNLIWSSPIDPLKMDFCRTHLNFANGHKTMTVRWPSLSEYKELFSYGFPPLLYKAKARYFNHNDQSEFGMAVDEAQEKFLNLPDDQSIWVRCIAE